MKDEFAHVGEERRQDDGTTYCVQTLCCSECNNKFAVKKNRVRKPPDQLAKMASRQGWAVDLKKGGHLCPDHNPQHKDQPPMAHTDRTLPKAKAKPPATMTSASRRTIFRELDSCYSEDRLRYKPGFTDTTIATKLELPVEWITKVREENFGPAGPDPEIAKLESDMAELAKKVSAAEVQAMTAAETAENLGKSLATLSRRLEALK